MVEDTLILLRKYLMLEIEEKYISKKIRWSFLINREAFFFYNHIAFRTPIFSTTLRAKSPRRKIERSMAKETCSSRLTRARKKKKKEKEIILRDGNSRIYEAKHDPRQWWNMVARFAVCRQGYGNKIIKGMVEEGGIRERERERGLPCSWQDAKRRKGKGDRRFSGSCCVIG